MLGYPDQALQRSHEALTLAQELSHPFSLAYALFLCGHCPSVPPGGHSDPGAGRGSDDACRTSRGFPFWLAWGTILQGWALAAQGQGEKGLPRCGKAWPTGGPRGQRYLGRIFLPCLPRLWNRPDRRGAQRLDEALAWSTRLGNACGKPSSIGSRGNCCCAGVADERRRKPAFSGPRHCPPPAGEVAGAAGRYEPESPLAAAGQARRSPCNCWPRSTAGSPRGLIRRPAGGQGAVGRAGGIMGGFTWGQLAAALCVEEMRWCPGPCRRALPDRRGPRCPEIF